MCEKGSQEDKEGRKEWGKEGGKKRGGKEIVNSWKEWEKNATGV